MSNAPCIKSMGGGESLVTMTGTYRDVEYTFICRGQTARALLSVLEDWANFKRQINKLWQ